MFTTQPAAGRRTALLPLLILVLFGCMTACKSTTDNTPTLSSINDLLVNGNGSAGNKFTLLNAALKRTGLDATLGQPGTYTLFAPTDDAFKAFGYADLNSINNAPLPVLQSVLQYHLVGSRLEASAIPTGVNNAQATAGGSTAYISRTTSTSATSTTATSTTATVFSINGARILSSGTPASNGIVYPIDRVLLPPLFGNIVNTIQGIPTLLPTASFTFLNAAVGRVGAISSLTATGPITLFAPTDAAFTAARPTIRTVADINAMNVDTLRKILTYHLVNGRIYTPLVSAGQSLTTAQGGVVTAGASTTALTVTGKSNGGTASTITGPDITATNGVIHIIDRLLLP
ncbi:fasciclin domain-containing protein [Spirosoma luteolum]